jgi:hypothetical protein
MSKYLQPCTTGLATDIFMDILSYSRGRTLCRVGKLIYLITPDAQGTHGSERLSFQNPAQSASA